MGEPTSILELFKEEKVDHEPSRYSTSNVLPQIDVLYDKEMTDASDYYSMTEQEAEMFGNEWVNTLSACSYPLQKTDLDSIAKFGIRHDQLISYLDTAKSSKENVIANQIALSQLDQHSFTVTNNVDLFMAELMEEHCNGDIFCAAYFDLCFTLSSKLYTCDDSESYDFP